jgi:hypothetical protein
MVCLWIPAFAGMTIFFETINKTFAKKAGPRIIQGLRAHHTALLSTELKSYLQACASLQLG